MAEPAYGPATLRSRIDDLRRRVLSLRDRAQDSHVPLDRRILRLVQRIQEGAWDAAAQCQSSLPEDGVLPSAQTLRPTTAPGEYASGVRELVGRLGPLREQLTKLVGSDEFDDLPSERTRLRQAYEVAELADAMIRQADGPSQQILMLPAWESMVRHAEDRYAELAALVRWRQRQRHAVATLREINCQLLAGGRPRWEAIIELAGRILHDLEEESQPDIFQPTSFDPPVVVATHAVNVAHFSGFLASSRDSMRSHRLNAVVAGLFADLGMLKAAPGVLANAKPLREDERADLERHPLESAAMVDRIAGFDPMLSKAIAQHHERLDGGGYPAAAGGEQILPIARLLACADVYVAMRSRRAHRPAGEPPAALTGVLAEADAGRLDESIARGLLNLSLYPVGTVVELATSEIAEVVATQDAQADPTLAARPVVKLILDRHGVPFPAPTYRNLAVRPDCRIVRTVAPEEMFFRRQSA